MSSDELEPVAPATSTTNTSGRGHCPHCGVCHTSDETCIQALQRLLLVTKPGANVRAIAEYVADLKANLHPKETCPTCSGSNDPREQIECETLPCLIGRDFRRPRLEEVIHRIESLLVPGADATGEVAVGTFDPDAAGCIRWNDGIVRGDFKEGDVFYCRPSVVKASGPTAS
ncbi:hypothetical protein [Pseudomonas sp. NPDC089569]|uniref:hypothetical protein n=1 Tax=Pseudomonas sp. NPDC089569 TaxID=3390722 RepID=UPI003D0955EF